MLYPDKLKKDFPIFESSPTLVYLDSASTSLKPYTVIDAVSNYYKNYSANVHRGIYDIAEKATEKFEAVRQKVAKFINTKDEKEIVFTHGATEGLNLIASSVSDLFDNLDGEIVVTALEHHANFVPWQNLAKNKNMIFKVIPITKSYELDIFSDNKKTLNLKKYISKNTKILAVSSISNVLGTVNPVCEIIKEARKINPQIIIVVDACQSAPHDKIDVQELNCDFLVFSGHKMLGPTGVGVLWGKKNLLDKMSPYQLGGSMIRTVSIDKTTWNDVPYKFEAGSPPIASVIGLGASIDYLLNIKISEIKQHEEKLINIAFDALKSDLGEQIELFQPKHNLSRSGILAFIVNKIHSHDIAQILASDNVCIRSGHHCAMPLHTQLGVSATNRASFYLYNTEKDVEILINSLKKAVSIFRK